DLLPHKTYLDLLTFFFFNDPAPPEIYTLSLHDALPICQPLHRPGKTRRASQPAEPGGVITPDAAARPLAGRRPAPRRASQRRCRSEEHTSELQSRGHLVCRLLLEKKKK